MKKKLFFISQCFPLPLDGGGKIKTFNTLQTLSKEYQIFAVFISERKAQKEDLKKFKELGIKVKVFKAVGMSESIKKNYWRLIWNYLQFRPHFVYQYRYPPAVVYIKNKIKNWQPDIIHVDHINTSQFLPNRKFLNKVLAKDYKLVLENHNVDHLMFKSRFYETKKLIRKVYLFLEGSLNYLYGRVNYPRYDLVLSISESESKYLRKYCKRVLNQRLIYPLRKVKTNKNKVYDLLFIGHLEWPPNEVALLWFGGKILPLIREEFPNLKLHIIGKENPRLESLKNNENIVFHGYQKSLNQFLAKSKIFILPFHTGAGVRIKSLTALQNGIPMVSTSLGVDGLKLVDGEDFLLANTEEEFAKKIIKLIKDKKLRDRISKNAMNFFEKNHSVKKNKDFLVQYLDNVKV